jgi:hypothetical protein
MCIHFTEESNADKLSYSRYRHLTGQDREIFSTCFIKYFIISKDTYNKNVSTLLKSGFHAMRASNPFLNLELFLRNALCVCVRLRAYET